MTQTERYKGDPRRQIQILTFEFVESFDEEIIFFSGEPASISASTRQEGEGGQGEGERRQRQGGGEGEEEEEDQAGNAQ